MLHLTGFDFLILTVVMVSTAIALVRGFTREILSILSWVLAVYGALLVAPLIQPLFANLIGGASDSPLASYGSLLSSFLIIIVGLSIYAGQIANRMQASSIGALDRSLGLIFGGLRGLLIVFFGYFILLLLMPEKQHPDWIAKARLRPVVQTGTAGLMAALPLSRLPLDMSRFDSLLQATENAVRDEALDASTRALLRQIENKKNENATEGERLYGRDFDEARRQTREAEQEKPQDETETKGYKDNERALIERLIENTEGLE